MTSGIGAGLVEFAGSLIDGKDVDQALAATGKAARSEGIDAAIQAGAGELISLFGEFDFVHSLERCVRLSKAANDGCVLDLVIRFPQHLDASICSNIGDGAVGTREIAGRATCLAITAGNGEICANTSILAREMGVTDATELSFFERDMAAAVESDCHRLTYQALSTNCENEDCRIEAAVNARYAPACDAISDPTTRQICRAGATQDGSACADLTDDGRADCCRQLVDVDARNACLGIQSTEISIDGPLNVSTGETHEYQLDYGPIPEGASFEVLFGDNTTPYRSIDGTHRFTFLQPGEYPIEAVLKDRDGNALASGSITVTADYPYSTLDLLQQTTHVLVTVCGSATDTYSDGTSTSPFERGCTQVYSINAVVEWDGLEFSIRYEGIEGDSTLVQITVDGTVAADLKHVAFVNAQVTMTDDDGEFRKFGVSLTGLPLKSAKSLPPVLDPSYKPVFEAFVEGPATAGHVASTTFEWLNPRPRTDWIARSPYQYNSTELIAYALVVFKTERISANDDPIYRTGR